jgi:xanthine dehydrogenase YagT iron-sulfur-binding subunit
MCRVTFSGRSFLRGSAFALRAIMVKATPTLFSQSEATLAQAPATVAGNAVATTLLINGTAHTLEIDPRMTLAEVLRGQLGLTGTKIACNRGACSACTILLDGSPICSCMMLAVDVGGRAVSTIEGLAKGDQLHPVQQAFIDHDAVQCGFCTPGMIMSCVALLAQKQPSAADVKSAISGHFCRCGTYPHAVTATLAAASASS